MMCPIHGRVKRKNGAGKYRNQERSNGHKKSEPKCIICYADKDSQPIKVI